MYYFFMDKLPLPVAPQSLTISYGGMNKTYDMIDDGEINILKLRWFQDIYFTIINHVIGFIHTTIANCQ